MSDRLLLQSAKHRKHTLKSICKNKNARTPRRSRALKTAEKVIFHTGLSKQNSPKV
nr:MAG TPA: hypothetical protein [Caudoviricetes sp.]